MKILRINFIFMLIIVTSLQHNRKHLPLDGGITYQDPSNLEDD